jgi:hypothetical protein
MKKFITLLVVAVIGMTTYAQTASIDGTSSTMKENVKQGVFKFNMPATTTADEVNRTAKYYVDYFTINYDEQNKIAVINMIDNSPEGRRVVTRFLLSNKVSMVSFDGNEYKITEFYDTFMK